MFSIWINDYQYWGYVDSSNSILDVGKQDQVCGFCGAPVWAAEFTRRPSGNGPIRYSICCGKGNVHLPLLRESPSELAALLSSTSRMSKEFMTKVRIYTESEFIYIINAYKKCI